MRVKERNSFKLVLKSIEVITESPETKAKVNKGASRGVDLKV
jgi:hypothetical protein